MSNKYYTVLAIFEAKQGKETILGEILTGLIASTLEEEGCINYDLYKSPDNPAAFMLYENWVSKKSHTRHCETPHVKAWQAKIRDLLARPYEVTFWKIVNCA